jgi:TetR/AcrR family transcriptional regulator, fatty acid metabolism regulator protein
MKTKISLKQKNIILTAIDIIDDLGIHKLSLKEIANRCNVTEPSIYRHFKNKQELLIKIIEFFYRYDVKIINEINKNQYEPDKALVLMAKKFGQIFDKYPNLATLPLYFDILIHDKELKNLLFKFENNRTQFMYKLMEEGEKKGIFSMEMQYEDTMLMLLGTIRATISKWRLAECSFSLEEKFEYIIETIIYRFMSN